jgi:hypothetical protein
MSNVGGSVEYDKGYNILASHHPNGVILSLKEEWSMS